jgi:cytoskeletal protein CcmA (bactofilin family)
MWKNKASQIEDPAYGPSTAPGKAEATSEIHVMKERDSAAAVSSAARPSAVWATASSRLGAGLLIKGEVSGSDDLLIEGTIEGSIQMEGHKVTVGASAKIVADILAGEIVVYGEVQGNLHARDRIEIKQDGAVLGELTTSRIMIEDGAYFKGSIEINRRAAAGNQRSERGAREAEAKVVPIPMGGTPTLHPTSFEKLSEKSAG